MLTVIEYAEQQRSLGRRIHFHDGVYWEELYPFYCKPAFIYKPFDIGARPARFHSLLGYTHQVLLPLQGNRSIFLMELNRTRLDGFSLSQLPSRKRTYVRRALEQCMIKPITDIERFLERMLEINISQALRQEKGAGVETPVKRFTEAAGEWRRQMRQEFALKGREWWGAFTADDILVAYIRTHQVDGIRDIYQTKSDTEYLKVHPMEALYFTILEKAASDPTCKRIVNSRPMHPSLNHFKEGFLFRAVEYPFYHSNPKIEEIAKGVLLNWRHWSIIHNLKKVK